MGNESSSLSSQSRTNSVGICGLTNLGNTCFCNSVIQCLYTLDVFRTSVINLNCVAPSRFGVFRSDSGTMNVDQFLVELQRTFASMNKSHGKSLASRKLFSAVTSTFQRYSPHEQEDANDFLHAVVNHLCDKSDDMIASGGKLLKKKLFGQLEHITKCTACDHSSQSLEDFLVLPLPVGQGGSTIKMSFTQLKAVDFLRGDSYICESCNCYQDAVRRMSVYQYTEILIVQIQRFKFDGAIGIASKLTEPFNFGDKILFKKDQIEKNYVLKGVVIHVGATLNSGHYVALVNASSLPCSPENSPPDHKGSWGLPRGDSANLKNNNSQEQSPMKHQSSKLESSAPQDWYLVDDEIVVPVSRDIVQCLMNGEQGRIRQRSLNVLATGTPYLLFYQLVDKKKPK